MRKLFLLFLLLPIAACNNESPTETGTVQVEKPALPAGITLVDEFKGDDTGIANEHVHKRQWREMEFEAFERPFWRGPFVRRRPTDTDSERQQPAVQRSRTEDGVTGRTALPSCTAEGRIQPATAEVAAGVSKVSRIASNSPARAESPLRR